MRRGIISGLKHWQERDIYYVQSNNSVEAALSRYKAGQTLVTCGPTAAVTCIAAMGGSVQSPTPGGWQPQPEDVLTLWFHDERNWTRLAKARPDTAPGQTDYSPNEVPQYYPVAVDEVFGARCRFEWTCLFSEIISHVSSGRAVQITLKDPGHFIPVVAYDQAQDALIYHDPWPSRFSDGEGFARRLSEAEFNDNVQSYALVYEGVQ